MAASAKVVPMDTDDKKKNASKKGPAAPAAAAVVRSVSVAAARPLVSVYKVDEKTVSSTESIKMPSVMLSPIRPDIVHFVHASMAKNRRQPYAVSAASGHQHSAESWGTGRAVARIPRVSGGGTSRAGQGAFGNMCRKGRMFAPTKTWRKWHRKINVNQKRYAVASALAASALPPLVMARGHTIENCQEIPLVVDNAVEAVQKTKAAKSILEKLAAFDDVSRVAESRKLRTGKGKMRNRRHVIRRGPLVVYGDDKGICQAFRNLPGIDLCHVDRLNLLQLAPGGHMGRFIIWTASAFRRLDDIWGSINRESVQKNGYTLPRPMMLQSDLTRLINSDEVQSTVRPARSEITRRTQKKNPLRNLGAMVKLNPFSLSVRRAELLAQERRAARRAARVEAARKGTKYVPSKEEVQEKKADKARDRAHSKAHQRNYTRLVSGGLSVPHKTMPTYEMVPVEGAKKLAVAAPVVEAAAAPAKKAAAPPKPAAAPAAAPAKGDKGAADKGAKADKGADKGAKADKGAAADKGAKADKGADKGDKGGKGKKA
jgi:large subunit ribosomal protein L4e